MNQPSLKNSRDWLDKLAYRMVFPYLFIYIVALGASGAQLGMVNSIGMIIAGILQGFYFIGASIAAARERELVPPEQMGRWIGITRFFKMVLSAILALTAGIIWDRVGPQYPFIAFVSIDLLIRMPLLISMPETLHSHFKKNADGDSHQ